MVDASVHKLLRVMVGLHSSKDEVWLLWHNVCLIRIMKPWLTERDRCRWPQGSKGSALRNSWCWRSDDIWIPSLAVAKRRPQEFVEGVFRRARSQKRSLIATTSGNITCAGGARVRDREETWEDTLSTAIDRDPRRTMGHISVRPVHVCRCLVPSGLPLHTTQD